MCIRLDQKILTLSISAITSLIFFPAAPPLVWKTLIRSSVRRSSSPRNLEVRGTVVSRINSKLICKRQHRQDTDLNKGGCSSVGRGVIHRLNVSGSIPGSECPHVKVSLSKASTLHGSWLPPLNCECVNWVNERKPL